MGAFLGALAILTLTVALIWEQVSLSSEEVRKGREAVLKLEREDALKCR